MSDASAPIVVTGAAGFIGRALVARLAGRGARVIAIVRNTAAFPADVAQRAVGVVTRATEWASLLAGARAVVHLAARAHMPAGDAPQDWIESDAAAAAALARSAAQAGVERFILVSSIKVLGETSGELPFRAGRPAAPADHYGFAKWCIEEAVREATSAGPSLTIIRPPLVYGPEVKANFRALLRLVDSGLPLPFASIANRRSVVFLDNLVDLIAVALDHPAAPDGTFLLRDDEEVSTPELIRRMARALRRPARLVPCPPPLLQAAARATGFGAAAERLIGSLAIDDRATRERLGWQPRVSLDDGLAATCGWYRRARAADRAR